ncbi:MAG TPA: hypothetical protein DHV84_06785 [Desulfotomaculum sp.]|jgi:flagellar assembly protein FliH|nr:hypothetical protein [Desulfotomaculum sp.]
MPLLSNQIIKKPHVSQVHYKITLINQDRITDNEFLASKEIERNIFKKEESNVLDQAKNEAEKLLAEARIKAQEIFIQAKKEGYQAGYQEGLGKAAREATEIRQSAFDLLDQAQKIKQVTIKSLEKEIVNLSCEIAEKIICSQLTLAPEVVLQIAKEAINLLLDKEQVSLLVNPEEKEVFLAHREEVLKNLPAGTKLNILTETNIKPGGLKIRTSQEELDATLDGCWEVLKKILVKE